MKHAHHLGWKPDLPDHRDHIFAIPHMAARPAHVDLTPSMPPVYDQGALGSCVGNAVAAAAQFDRRNQHVADYVPSRLMIYLEARRLEGTVNYDAGCEIRDGMKAMAKLGACDEKLWPYIIKKYKQKPPASAYKAALSDQAIDYARVIQSAVTCETILATGFPIVFGFTVYESFESTEVELSGVVPMPGPNEAVIGGHAVPMVGYDSAAKRFICRNSWGASWGQKGYFTFPYDYALNLNLADDFWVMRSVG